MRALVNKWHDLFLLQHSLFGLPWVVIGALLPFLLGMPIKINALHWFYIVLAFFSARFAGMSLNRLIDCEIDKKNPRTKQRALARGDITKQQVLTVAVTNMIVFFFACWNINTYTFLLSPLVAALLVLYSYTKRVTSLCHFVLGGIHFLAPVVAFAAVSGMMAPAPLVLGLALLAIISSGDIFYALQDVEFDREYGLYSIPARLGVERAKALAVALQAVAVSLLVMFGVFFQLSFIYFFGCAVVFSMYIMAYRKNRLVFYMNSYVGIVMMLALIGELIWQKL